MNYSKIMTIVCIIILSLAACKAAKKTGTGEDTLCSDASFQVAIISDVDDFEVKDRNGNHIGPASLTVTNTFNEGNLRTDVKKPDFKINQQDYTETTTLSWMYRNEVPTLSLDAIKLLSLDSDRDLVGDSLNRFLKDNSINLNGGSITRWRTTDVPSHPDAKDAAGVKKIEINYKTSRGREDSLSGIYFFRKVPVAIDREAKASAGENECQIVNINIPEWLSFDIMTN